MSSNPETVSTTTTPTAPLAQKPQIFINHVDQAVSAEMIQAACDAICGLNTSNVVLKQSHDNNYKNCLITLTSNENAKKLHETKQLKIGETLLRLDPYQAQYPNLFLRNTDNLTLEQIEEGMKQIVKGFFHVYYGTFQVSFFIEDEAELNKLISQPHKIADKVCSFQKYVTHSNKQEKNCLFIRYTVGQPLNLTLEESLKKDFGQIKLFSLDQNQQQQLMVASVTFENAIDAEKLFNHITSNQNILYKTSVTVQWKSSEEFIDQKLYLKSLKPSSKEQEITEALSVLGGEVVNVERQVQKITNTDITQYTAVVQMGSPKQCEDIMIKAHSNLKIKQLFVDNSPYIAPYISPTELKKLKKNAQNNLNNQNQGRTSLIGQEQLPFMSSQQLTQQQQYQMFQLPFNQGMNNQYMNPFFTQNQGQQAGFYNRKQQSQYDNLFYQQQQLAVQQQFYYQQQKQPYQQQQQSTQDQDKYQQKFRQNQSDRQPRAQNKNNTQKNNNQYQQQRQQPKQQQQSNQQQQQFAANNSLPYQKMTETQMVELLKSDTKAFENTVIPSLKDIVKKELSASFATNVHQIGDIVEMLVDPEIFTNEQVIQLIYNKTELNSRIEEAIALLNGAN